MISVYDTPPTLMEVGQHYVRGESGPVYRTAAITDRGTVSLNATQSITGDYTLHANTKDIPDGWYEIDGDELVQREAAVTRQSVKYRQSQVPILRRLY